MRYTEFKSLIEQRLDEINMSPTNLRELASGIAARVGIEFELVVPGYQSGEDSGEPDYDTNESTRNSDIRDVVAFFDRGDMNSSGQIKRFEQELQEKFHEWQTEQVSDLWDSEGYSFLSDFIADYEGFADEELEAAVEEAWGDRNSDHYTRAWDQFFDEHSGDYSETEWLRSEYRDYEDVSREFDVYWPDVKFLDDNGEEFANSMSRALGRTVTYNHEYHGAERNDTDYVAEPDGSIKGNADEIGIEFVSPPLSIAEMIKDLSAVNRWCAKSGAYTNQSTGLHINVSVPGYSLQRLDFVKLVLLMGDAYVLQLFGRTGNTYATSALKVIQDRAAQNPATVAELMQQMKTHLNAAATKALAASAGGKRYSANIKQDYVEFRSPGGNWLADYETGKVEQTILRFVVALDAALDDTKYQNEYAKKLYKLLATNTAADSTLQHFANFSAGLMPAEQLKHAVRSVQAGRSAERNANVGPTNRFYEWVATVFYPVIGHTNGQYHVVDITARTAAEAKSLVRVQLGSQSQFVSDDKIQVKAIGYAGVAEPTDPEREPGMYEIVNADTGRPVERFTANGKDDAHQKFANYMSHFGLGAEGFELRKI